MRFRGMEPESSRATECLLDLGYAAAADLEWQVQGDARGRGTEATGGDPQRRNRGGGSGQGGAASGHVCRLGRLPTRSNSAFTARTSNLFGSKPEPRHSIMAACSSWLGSVIAAT